jgi:hypothetical protein
MQFKLWLWCYCVDLKIFLYCICNLKPCGVLSKKLFITTKNSALSKFTNVKKNNIYKKCVILLHIHPYKQWYHKNIEFCKIFNRPKNIYFKVKIISISQLRFELHLSKLKSQTITSEHIRQHKILTDNNDTDI